MARGRVTLAALAAAVALAWLPAAALAGEVIVVDGDHALPRQDPLVPTRADSDLPSPPGGAAQPIAVAAVARRGDPTLQRRGERAVVRALRSAVRSRRLGAVRSRLLARAYRSARALRRRLPRRRAGELGYVIGRIERLALSRRLIPSSIAGKPVRRGSDSASHLPHGRSGLNDTGRRRSGARTRLADGALPVGYPPGLELRPGAP